MAKFKRGYGIFQKNINDLYDIVSCDTGKVVVYDLTIEELTSDYMENGSVFIKLKDDGKELQKNKGN